MFEIYFLRFVTVFIFTDKKDKLFYDVHLISLCFTLYLVTLIKSLLNSISLKFFYKKFSK